MMGIVRRGLWHRLAPQTASRGVCNFDPRIDHNPYQKEIGSREIVGHGIGGMPHYSDTPMCPFPAIRYRECTPELMAMREKERGDWRKLTICEKKFLYRASFRQTIAEVEAPDSEWKNILGCVLLGLAMSIWIFIWQHHYVHIDWPKSFDNDSRIAQYYRMVEINNQPITGNYRPPGAELRVHPMNKSMLQKSSSEEDNGC